MPTTKFHAGYATESSTQISCFSLNPLKHHLEPRPVNAVIMLTVFASLERQHATHLIPTLDLGFYRFSKSHGFGENLKGCRILQKYRQVKSLPARYRKPYLLSLLNRLINRLMADRMYRIRDLNYTFHCL